MHDTGVIQSTSLIGSRDARLMSAQRGGLAGQLDVTTPWFGRAIPGPQPCEVIPFPILDWGWAARPAAKTNLLFVCRTHRALGPMAAGLARAAYGGLDICVESAGLTPGAVDPRAIAAMAEVDIDISQTPRASVRDLDLERFEIVVSLGVHRLGVNRGQMALSWDIPELERVSDRSALLALRETRDALSVRIRALRAVLTAAGQA